MIGPLSSGILVGCLRALAWLCWIIAGLLIVMIAAQTMRGEEPAIVGVLVSAALFAGGGFVCRWLAHFFASE